MGDGVVLTFSKPDIIGIFDVCLRLNTDPSGVFDEIDFGYTNDELQFIYPLGLFLQLCCIVIDYITPNSPIFYYFRVEKRLH